MNAVRTIVFAKAPLPGLAKTRLIPALGAEGAAALARRMLVHTLDAATAAGTGPVEVCVTPAADDPAWGDFAFPDGLDLSTQGGGSLGPRLARASLRWLERGTPVLCVGTDCPAIDAAALEAAARSLSKSDAVLWPALDGGYVLLGLRRYSPEVFRDIPWGTASVAAMTLERLRRLGWKVEIGPRLGDIDAPDDLAVVPGRWLAEIGLPVPASGNGQPAATRGRLPGPR